MPNCLKKCMLLSSMDALIPAQKVDGTRASFGSLTITSSPLQRNLINVKYLVYQATNIWTMRCRIEKNGRQRVNFKSNNGWQRYANIVRPSDKLKRHDFAQQNTNR